MTAFLLESARLGVPVVLDGIVSCAAALVADRMDGTARAWWVAGHVSTEPAFPTGPRGPRARPPARSGPAPREGTGALLAIPLLNAAAATLAEMATFQDAGVSNAPGRG